MSDYEDRGISSMPVGEHTIVTIDDPVAWVPVQLPHGLGVVWVRTRFNGRIVEIAIAADATNKTRPAP